MCLRNPSFSTVSPSSLMSFFCWIRSSTYLFSTGRQLHNGARQGITSRKGTRTSRSYWRPPSQMHRYKVSCPRLRTDLNITRLNRTFLSTARRSRDTSYVIKAAVKHVSCFRSSTLRRHICRPACMARPQALALVKPSLRTMSVCKSSWSI